MNLIGAGYSVGKDSTAQQPTGRELDERRVARIRNKEIRIRLSEHSTFWPRASGAAQCGIAA